MLSETSGVPEVSEVLRMDRCASAARDDAETGDEEAVRTGADWTGATEGAVAGGTAATPAAGAKLVGASPTGLNGSVSVPTVDSATAVDTVGAEMPPGAKIDVFAGCVTAGCTTVGCDATPPPTMPAVGCDADCVPCGATGVVTGEAAGALKRACSSLLRESKDSLL